MNDSRGNKLVWLMGFLGLMGCSSEQVVEPAIEEQKGTAIAFTADLSEQAVTRADSPLEDYTSSFRVWAYKNMTETTGNYGGLQTVMNQYHVEWTANTAATTTTNSHDWEYILLSHPSQTIKFWDFGAKAYRFFGSAEMSATPGTWTHQTEEGVESYRYSCTADATNAEDAPFYTHLWFSNGDAGDYPTRLFGRPVTLEFIKPFAEVRFLFSYSDPNADPLPMLEDPDFRPVTPATRIAEKGTMTITFPLTGTETQESWTSTPDFSSKYLVSFTTPANHYAVLPIRDQCAYLLTVTVNGADKSCTVPAQYMTWQPGYLYTYIFKVNDEGGVELQTVNIGVKDWVDADPANHYLYNW